MSDLSAHSRRAAFLLIFLPLIGEVTANSHHLPADINELTDRALAFERHWNVFVRTVAGCPELGETTPETCTHPRSIDYAAYFKARSEAKKLFDLVEPQQQ